MKNLLSTVALLGVIACSPAFAADTTVEMLNKRDDGAKMAYSEDITRIDVGDTITWLPTSKGHNVEFVAGPEGWDAPKKSKNNKEVAITFDIPGIYFYQISTEWPRWEPCLIMLIANPLFVILQGQV